MYMFTNIYEYKELVMTGITKLITNEEFTDENEKEAVLNFVETKGIPLSTPNLAIRLANAETLEERQEVLIQSLLQSVSNIFLGQYGI